MLGDALRTAGVLRSPETLHSVFAFSVIPGRKRFHALEQLKDRANFKQFLSKSLYNLPDLSINISTPLETQQRQFKLEKKETKKSTEERHTLYR